MIRIPYSPEGTQKTDGMDIAGLTEAMRNGQIVEGTAVRCDSYKNLFISFGEHLGMIPWNETALGAREGRVKDIAVISLVGQKVCFKVVAVNQKSSPPMILLSRRLAQEEVMNYLLHSLKPGDILPGKITHLARFGAFVDIGCGIISMIGIENISIARIFHPSERFHPGQMIYSIVLDTDWEKERIILSHKELLGSWAENISAFRTGDTVTGIVRSIKSYGLFIELTPNLSGLAEYNPEYIGGDTVTVYIKTIIPEKMKIKLAIVGRADINEQARHFDYYLRDGHIDRWVYSPPESLKLIETDFEI